MKILKFGGTSLGTPERMRRVYDLVEQTGGDRLVVLSAVSGTTNTLVELDRDLKSGSQETFNNRLSDLRLHYQEYINNLFTSEEGKSAGQDILRSHFEEMARLSRQSYEPLFEKKLLAQGELLSTKIFHAFLHEQQTQSYLLPALSFMKTDEHREPDYAYIREKLHEQIKDHPSTLYITQGYICLNDQGKIDNLQRGGSDYTATIIGAVMKAEEVQIWTDISGMHNNDPRVVDNTFPIHHLSFDEAAELAYFGAKILHPLCVFPAQKYGVKVRLKNTMEPDAQGTLIDHKGDQGIITAIAAKDNITAIKIKSSRMLMAYGFLTRVFQVFEKYKTPIDMITTSEVAVSLTIDDNHGLDKIMQELNTFATTEVDHEQSIICVVGNFVAQNKGVVTRVFDALERVPVRMISYGGSRHNISLLLSMEYKAEALKLLNQYLFSHESEK